MIGLCPGNGTEPFIGLYRLAGQSRAGPDVLLKCVDQILRSSPANFHFILITSGVQHSSCEMAQVRHDAVRKRGCIVSCRWETEILVQRLDQAGVANFQAKGPLAPLDLVTGLQASSDCKEGLLPVCWAIEDQDFPALVPHSPANPNKTKHIRNFRRQIVEKAGIYRETLLDPGPDLALAPVRTDQGQASCHAGDGILTPTQLVGNIGQSMLGILGHDFKIGYPFFFWSWFLPIIEDL